MDLCIQFVNVFFKLVKDDKSLPLILIVQTPSPSKPPVPPPGGRGVKPNVIRVKTWQLKKDPP